MVEIKYHLYKEATPSTWYNTLVAALGDNDVTVQLATTNGATFKHSTGVAANFCLKEVIPGWLTTTDYKDVLTIVLESVDTVLMDLT